MVDTIADVLVLSRQYWGRGIRGTSSERSQRDSGARSHLLLEQA